MMDAHAVCQRVYVWHTDLVRVVVKVGGGGIAMDAVGIATQTAPQCG